MRSANRLYVLLFLVGACTINASPDCEENPDTFQCMDAQELFDLAQDQGSEANGNDSSQAEETPSAADKPVSQDPFGYLHVVGTWDLPPGTPQETDLMDQTLESYGVIFDLVPVECRVRIEATEDLHLFSLWVYDGPRWAGLWVAGGEPFRESVYQHNSDDPSNASIDGEMITLVGEKSERGMELRHFPRDNIFRTFEIEVLEEDYAQGRIVLEDLCTQGEPEAPCFGTLDAEFVCDPEVVFGPIGGNTDPDDQEGKGIE
jgi:hypothetical protein